MTDWPTFLVPFALIAALYAAVGHGGASGYIAVMALAGVAPAVMKPTALTLDDMMKAVDKTRRIDGMTLEQKEKR